MKKKTYSVQIDATPAVVWTTLWSPATYNAWTSVFAEGSSAETDWKEGSQVIFGDGKGNGMISRIATSRPNEFMSFEHMGVIKDGKKEPAPEWAGAQENYTLVSKNGRTELNVEIDIDGDMAAYFDKTFPVALDKLKSLAEKAGHPETAL